MYDDAATVIGTGLGCLISIIVIVVKIAFYGLVLYALLKVAGFIG